MKKIKFSLIIMLMFVLMTSTVLAETLVPVTYDISIDFTAERDFTLLMPNGYERHFSWDPGTTHSDTTFSHEIYFDLNESRYCSNSANYEDINSGLMSMLSVCESAVSSNNQTTYLSEQLITCNNNLNIYEADFNSEKLYKEACLTDLDEEKTNSLEFSQDLKSCESNLNSKTATANLYPVCSSDLVKQKSLTTKFGFGGIILGLGVGWFLWKRKKNIGPSDQVENGNYRDAPASIETREHLRREYERRSNPENNHSRSTAEEANTFRKFDEPRG